MKKNKDSAPFSDRIEAGEGDYKLLFFDVKVLENYINDPKYNVVTDGFVGHIGIGDDKLCDTNENLGYIQQFTIARGPNNERVIAAFLCHLTPMNSTHQKRWNSYEVHGEFTLDSDYVNASLYGRFPKNMSIFEAFLKEQEIINEMCKLASRENLFKKTFTLRNAPKGFSIIFYPTTGAYLQFVSTLHKLLTDNINIKFFNDEIDLYEYKRIDKNTQERVSKSKIRLLEEWIRINFHLPQKDGMRLLIEPFKQIRNDRSKDVHEILEDSYCPEVFEKQKELMNNSYDSLSYIRKMFQQFDGAEKCQIPSYLKEGKVKLC